MEPTSVVSIGEALTTSLQTTITETMTMLSSLLPIALGLVGAGLVITFGLKFFKKITGKA